MFLIYIYIYTNDKKKKTTRRMARGHRNMAVGRRLVLGTGAIGMSLLQALQDDACHLEES
jgi:hypothetical protein